MKWQNMTKMLLSWGLDMAVVRVTCSMGVVSLMNWMIRGRRYTA